MASETTTDPTSSTTDTPSSAADVPSSTANVLSSTADTPSSTTDAPSETIVRPTRLAAYGLLAAVSASLANAVVLVAAVDVLGVPGGFPLSWGPVLASSAIPAVVATAVYGVIARVARRPNRAFAVVAVLVLALSFVPFASPPPELVGAPPSVFLALGTMHVAAAVAIAGSLSRVPRRADAAGSSP